eukprot:5076997-Prorocentrum_lima.AAC.1
MVPAHHCTHSKDQTTLSHSPLQTHLPFTSHSQTLQQLASQEIIGLMAASPSSQHHGLQKGFIHSGSPPDTPQNTREGLGMEEELGLLCLGRFPGLRRGLLAEDGRGRQQACPSFPCRCFARPIPAQPHSPT